MGIPDFGRLTAQIFGNVSRTEHLLLQEFKVKKGSKDVWGPIPMPPNAVVKDADVKTMVQYILTLK